MFFEDYVCQANAIDRTNFFELLKKLFKSMQNDVLLLFFLEKTDFWEISLKLGAFTKYGPRADSGDWLCPDYKLGVTAEQRSFRETLTSLKG